MRRWKETRDVGRVAEENFRVLEKPEFVGPKKSKWVKNVHCRFNFVQNSIVPSKWKLGMSKNEKHL
jgi:hypothetical protein